MKLLRIEKRNQHTSSIMRIVRDSNVIISAFLFGGPPAEIIQLALKEKASCFISIAILEEIQAVLQRPKFKLSASQVLYVIEQLHDLCTVVTPKHHVHMIDNDPSDNMILECAQAANANLIVSGDSHLLDLKSWQGISVISPTDAVQMINQTGKI